MANQIAIHLRCRPGEAFITEAESHIVTSESAAAAALSGAMPKLVPATGGTLDVAAGIVALEGMIGRLADDHARARALAEGLAALSGIDVDPNLVDSNIVLARPTEAAPGTVAEALIGEGVLVLPFGPFLRLVTHHEFTDADADETLTAFGAVLERVGR
jgi:threonine aldolase